MKSGFSKFGHWLCFIVFVQLPAGLFAAGTVRQIEIVNDWEIHKQDEPVVVGLKDIDIDFDVRSVRVWDGEREIASQLDDLDGNGLADELAFLNLQPFCELSVNIYRLFLIEINTISNQLRFESRTMMMQMIIDITGSRDRQRPDRYMFSFRVTDQHFCINTGRIII